MGVHSNVALAKDSGLAVNRGIVVDERLRTSDPSIYAVGDCAEFCGVVWGIIPAALEEAPVAAKSILASAGLIPADAASVYAQTVPKTALKVGDVELMSIGKAVLARKKPRAAHTRSFRASGTTAAATRNSCSRRTVRSPAQLSMVQKRISPLSRRWSENPRRARNSKPFSRSSGTLRGELFSCGRD
jgi:pyruvate/2-oxoglutarate dehydrogenase complex dihydrolipoamide dehydrogenase (E3) component